MGVYYSDPKDESICQGCGGVNPVWFAPNEEWNAVYGNEGPVQFACPVCFIRDAEAKGITPPSWRLSAETREHYAAKAVHPKPNCSACGDTGWRGVFWCPDCRTS